MRQHLLKDAQRFCLEKQPLAIEQLLDLEHIEENGLIELIPIIHKPLIPPKHQVLADDPIFSQYGELRLLVILPLLESGLVLAQSGFFLVVLLLGQVHVGHLSLILGGGVVSLLLALEETVGLDGEDLAVGVD